jgi:hypothetical protein
MRHLYLYASQWLGTYKHYQQVFPKTMALGATTPLDPPDCNTSFIGTLAHPSVRIAKKGNTPEFYLKARQ